MIVRVPARYLVAASFTLLAGCGLPLPTDGFVIDLPGNMGRIEFPGATTGTDPASGPTAQPAVMPQLPASAPTLPAGATGILVDLRAQVGPASSFVLATNRNHTADNFPSGDAKLTKLKELRPTWGDRRYMYRIGHGPTDGRLDYDYMTGYHFEQCWDKQGGYPYDDLRNALKEANALDAEQLHVINFGTGTPEEAARYVSYLNDPADPNRAAHPYPVQQARFFELGNEISWSSVRGHAEYAATDAQYAQRAKLFAQAMRKASPTAIQIGAVATTNSNWLGDGWSGGASTVKTLIQTMGNDVDFLIFHGYPSWPLKKDGDLLTLMAQNAWNDAKLTTEIEPALHQYATHPVYLANTEFFTELYSDAATARGMFGALYSADTVTLAFNHQIRIANQFCLDHGDQADASFFFHDDPQQVTPIFQFQRLLAQHWGDTVVKTTTQLVPTVHVNGASAQLDMPRLACTASVGQNGKIYVMVTNRTQDQDVTAQVALGLQPRQAIAYVLKGDHGWSSTGTEVQVQSSSPDMSRALTFPAASVTLLELTP